MNTVIRKLIAKELHVNRLLVGIGVVAGIGSTVVAAFGPVGFNIGALTWLSTIIGMGVILSLYGIMNERKEHALEFVMSLPLSVAGYVRAKMIGLVLCFFITWSVSVAAALVLVFAKDSVPDGIAPYLLLLSVFMLANFGVVLGGTMLARNEGTTTAIVIITNMAVTLFMFIVAPMRGIREYMWATAPVWNSTFWAVLGCELAVLVISLTLPLLIVARRRDFL
jgi:ABC-type transport system involved in multi-copper enzyme maturation permease subunit